MSDVFAGLLVVLAAAAAAAFSLFMVWTFALGVVGLLSEPHCLRAGYPKVNITWNFQRYCVKREDQTDRVVPYAEVR